MAEKLNKSKLPSIADVSGNTDNTYSTYLNAHAAGGEGTAICFGAQQSNDVHASAIELAVKFDQVMIQGMKDFDGIEPFSKSMKSNISLIRGNPIADVALKNNESSSVLSKQDGKEKINKQKLKACVSKTKKPLANHTVSENKAPQIQVGHKTSEKRKVILEHSTSAIAFGKDSKDTAKLLEAQDDVTLIPGESVPSPNSSLNDKNNKMRRSILIAAVRNIVSGGMCDVGINPNCFSLVYRITEDENGKWPVAPVLVRRCFCAEKLTPFGSLALEVGNKVIGNCTSLEEYLLFDKYPSELNEEQQNQMLIIENRLHRAREAFENATGPLLDSRPALATNLNDEATAPLQIINATVYYAKDSGPHGTSKEIENIIAQFLQHTGYGHKMQGCNINIKYRLISEAKFSELVSEMYAQTHNDSPNASDKKSHAAMQNLLSTEGTNVTDENNCSSSIWDGDASLSFSAVCSKSHGSGTNLSNDTSFELYSDTTENQKYNPQDFYKCAEVGDRYTNTTPNNDIANDQRKSESNDGQFLVCTENGADLSWRRKVQVPSGFEELVKDFQPTAEVNSLDFQESHNTLPQESPPSYAFDAYLDQQIYCLAEQLLKHQISEKELQEKAQKTKEFQNSNKITNSNFPNLVERLNKISDGQVEIQRLEAELAMHKRQELLDWNTLKQHVRWEREQLHLELESKQLQKSNNCSNLAQCMEHWKKVNDGEAEMQKLLATQNQQQQYNVQAPQDPRRVEYLRANDQTYGTNAHENVEKQYGIPNYEEPQNLLHNPKAQQQCPLQDDFHGTKQNQTINHHLKLEQERYSYDQQQQKQQALIPQAAQQQTQSLQCVQQQRNMKSQAPNQQQQFLQNRWEQLASPPLQHVLPKVPQQQCHTPTQQQQTSQYNSPLQLPYEKSVLLVSPSQKCDAPVNYQTVSQQQQHPIQQINIPLQQNALSQHAKNTPQNTMYPYGYFSAFDPYAQTPNTSVSYGQKIPAEKQQQHMPYSSQYNCHDAAAKTGKPSIG